MANPAYIKDSAGNWQEIATATTDLSNYANLTTTPISGFRNAIINGDFRVWQRGTSITPTNGGYSADRWLTWFDGSGSTRSITQQAFTPGATGITGYEPSHFFRYSQSVAGSSATHNFLLQPIEDVRTFAGQTITISFWAKAGSNITLPGLRMGQGFGVGGSPFVYTQVTTNINVTTSWQKFTYTVTMPSISGKTIGTNNPFVSPVFELPINSTFTLDFWGVQIEKGSIATPFEQRPIGTELALCQRYYYRLAPGAAFKTLGWGAANASAPVAAAIHIKTPVTMRTTPTGLENTTTRLTDYQSGFPVTNMTIDVDRTWNDVVKVSVDASGLTAFRPLALETNGAGGYVAFSAEL